jgi:pimeloyl-ACP methyl ester carboxylesterase
MSQGTQSRDEGVRVHTEDSYLQTDGASLRYRDQGRGPAVIFIHGWTLDLDMWEPQIAALSANFRVIRLDRRGFGLSSGRPSLSCDIADLHALTRHLELRQVALVGMSQGTRVALEFSRSSPGMIACLVLHGPPPMGTADASDIPYEHYCALVRKSGMAAFRREWAAHPLAQLRTQDQEPRELLARMIARYAGHDLTGTPAEAPVAAAPGSPAMLRAPVLVIRGEFDPGTRKAAAEALASRLSQAELQEIPDAGHLCNLDNPSAYNAAINSFLARHTLLPRAH